MSAPLSLPPEMADPSVSWGELFADWCASAPEGSAAASAYRDFSALRPDHNRPVRFSRPRPPPSPAPLTAEPQHGHGAEPCHHCGQAERCDCPCVVCCGERRELAEHLAVAPAPAACPPEPRSWIQRQLDQEWERANHAGPGCPFCDAIFSCDCWSRRREMHEAEERRRVRDERATIARAIAEGKCYCASLPQNDDYPEMCDICCREEALRCTGCGQLQCRPECCGDCGSCSRCRGPECSRCHSWDCCCYDDREDASSCGCGACEEHDWRAEEGWM